MSDEFVTDHAHRQTYEQPASIRLVRGLIHQRDLSNRVFGSGQ